MIRITLLGVTPAQMRAIWAAEEKDYSDYTDFILSTMSEEMRESLDIQDIGAA